MFKFVALTLLLAFSGAQAFWTSCPGILAPTSVSSPVCSGASCTVTRGQAFTADVGVVFNAAHSVLSTRIVVFVGGVGVEIPQDPPADNICNSLFRDGVFAGCPTVPNVPYVWRVSLTVSANTPVASNTRVRFEGLEGGVSRICADVTANIVG